MPFMMRKNGAKWCVYTQGADGQPKGDPKGCHDSEAAAKRQMAALYVHVPEAKKGAPGQSFLDSFLGILKGLGQKAVWSTAKVNDLPDSSFLHIEAGGKKDESGRTTPRSLRHFPFKDHNGMVDIPHLRNAIARIPQSSLSAGLKKSLQDRAQAMLERINAGKALEEKDLSLGQQESVIREAWYAKRPRNTSGEVAMDSPWPWVREVFDDYIICDGKDGLMKIPYGKNAEGVIDFGEPVKVEVRYQEVKGKALIVKQADGQYRWFGWVSNHFRDRDNPPEIISGKAHKEFVSHAEKTGQYPGLWLWHVPGSKVGRADWLEFSDGFLLMSGLFDKGREAVAERLTASKDPLTMSHGFWRLKADKEKAITDRYRMVEASITPVGVEANPWTRFSTAKEVSVLTPKKKEFLTKFLGAEMVAQLEADTDTMRKAAEEAGVDWKEVEAIEEPAADQAAQAADTKATPQAADTTALDTKAIVDQMVPALVEALGLKALSDTLDDLKAKTEAIGALQGDVAALREAVTALKATDDAKIAAKMTPKANAPLVLSWMKNAASKSPESVAQKDDPLVAKEPAFDGFVNSAVASMLSGNGGS